MSWLLQMQPGGRKNRTFYELKRKRGEMNFWRHRTQQQKLTALIGWGFMLACVLSACSAAGFEIPLAGRPIQMEPGVFQSNSVAWVMTPSLTPFQPVLPGTAAYTETAEQPIVTAPSTMTATVLFSETVTPTPATVTPSQAKVTLTVTGTRFPSPTPKKTATLQSGQPTLTLTRGFTQTLTRTQVLVNFTPTLTTTSQPATAAPTSQPQNTATYTVVPATRTITSAPVGCAYSENSGFESTLITLINEERVSKGLAAYGVNGLLTSAARGHSQDMACNAYFSHTGLDGSTSASRVAAQGYSYSWVGENIYAGSGGYNTPESAFAYWMQSPAHYANLMNTNYTEIGIGYVFYTSSPYGGYFTANFARP
jgi:uncharacterized protein YkwD